MSQHDLRETLLLSIYDELKPEEKYLLEEHVAHCRDCGEALSEMQSLHELLNRTRLADPPEELLWQARQSLWTRLDTAEAHPEKGLLARIRAWWVAPGIQASSGGPYPFSPLRIGGALATLAIGILAGYVFFGADIDTEQIPLGESGIANVRFIEDGDQESPIEVVFDSVRPVRINGDVSSPDVRRVLRYAALNERNDGVRLRAMNELYGHFEDDPDAEFRGTLLSVLRTDRNAGVRRSALNALQRLPVDSQIQSAFLDVLRYDPNPGLRVAAINALESSALEGSVLDEDTLNVLRESVASDENNYVRIRSQSLLREVDYK